jgi:hypothetical protein
LFRTCHEDTLEHLEHIIKRLDARCSSFEPTGLDVKVTVKVSNPTLRQSHLPTLTMLNDLMKSTGVVKALVLHHINIDEEKSALLFNGLELNQSMAKLSFINCQFSEEAIHAFIKFVQIKVNRGTNNLKTLHFDCWHSNRTSLFAPMLNGSALHTLELGQYHDNFPMLFELLVLNDSNIRLRRLVLGRRLQPSDLVPLSRYLAQTSTLQGLRIAPPRLACPGPSLPRQWQPIACLYLGRRQTIQSIVVSLILCAKCQSRNSTEGLWRRQVQ